MRSEQHVLNQILTLAHSDDRIRAALLNGSRVNPNAPKDFMQDYDVVYYIKDIKDISYKTDQSWIKEFGELVMLQQNNFEDGSYIFLMQFQDSIRIDLSFRDIKGIHEDITKDSLTRKLLDKDGVIGVIPEPNESTYVTAKPSREVWAATLNELWWLQIYIAKELWREELPLVKQLYDVHFIRCIRELVKWHAGYEHHWNINAGNCGKWFKRVLREELYEEYISYYTGKDYEEIWDRLLRVGAFIRRLGVPLAQRLGYEYPMQEDENVSKYIRRIRNLASNAKSLES